MERLRNLLKKFVLHNDFSCIMAQRVARKGRLVVRQTEDLSPVNVPEILREMRGFISLYRTEPGKPSSFILMAKDPGCGTFEGFEEKFWKFLESMHDFDKKLADHDPRVNNNPEDPEFCYSINGEAFFIIALHPLSPRRARRFPYPSIVFNPHQQFENLRKNGTFHKIRNTIRRRDKKFQEPNPMLKDFGKKSEVYQYLGKVYAPDAPVPLNFERTT